MKTIDVVAVGTAGLSAVVVVAAHGQADTTNSSNDDRRCEPCRNLEGLVVMMKDGNGRHPGNRLWGDGWGWSWFDAGNPSTTTSTDYKTNRQHRQPCHVPAQASDWIYVGGYPPLKR